MRPAARIFADVLADRMRAHGLVPARVGADAVASIAHDVTVAVYADCYQTLGDWVLEELGEEEDEDVARGVARELLRAQMRRARRVW